MIVSSLFFACMVTYYFKLIRIQCNIFSQSVFRITHESQYFKTIQYYTLYNIQCMITITNEWFILNIIYLKSTFYTYQLRSNYNKMYHDDADTLFIKYVTRDLIGLSLKTLLNVVLKFSKNIQFWHTDTDRKKVIIRQKYCALVFPRHKTYENGKIFLFVSVLFF